jgi:heme-degrading monooxygenase HmoA
MALAVMKYDLPAAEQVAAYNEKARTAWIPAVLRQPGLKEFRAYRNPYRITPEVMIHTEWDSLSSWLGWVESDDYATITEEMKGVGCANISVEVWDASPIIPEPLKPTG